MLFYIALVLSFVVTSVSSCLTASALVFPFVVTSAGSCLTASATKKLQGEIIMHKKIGSAMNTETRTIKIEDGKIIYRLERDGICDYLTYNEELIKILKLRKLKPFRSKAKRLMLGVRENSDEIRFYLHDLAYACYIGLVKYETFLQDIKEYRNHKEKNNLTIDHADGNIQNNTVYNLSLMTRGENSQKNDITTRFQTPFSILTVAYVRGMYRICLTQKCPLSKIPPAIKEAGIIPHSELISTMQFACATAAEYISCLKHLSKYTLECTEPLRNGKGWIKYSAKSYSFVNIESALRNQELLATLPLGDFQCASDIKK